MARHLELLRLVCLAAAVTAGRAMLHFDFRSDLYRPYGDGGSSRDFWHRGALESVSRVATQRAMLGRVLTDGKSEDISAADMALSPHCDKGHYWLTVGIGTPPQPTNLMVDMAGSLSWTHCKQTNTPESTVGKVEPPLYDPFKSSSYYALSCGACAGAEVPNQSCEDESCVYTDDYSKSEGAVALETFTFGVHHNVSLHQTFGCGLPKFGSNNTGMLSLSPSSLSLISQKGIPKFSYCLTPLAEHKRSPIMFGEMADLHKYNTTGPIQTTSMLKNPVKDIFYYVPLVGLSLGTKRLNVPVASLALKPNGTGGTLVDPANTLAWLAEPAFEEVKKAVLQAVKLPPTAPNRTVEPYAVCFALPPGTTMSSVPMPPLVLHFEGGAEMVLQREGYFQEPNPGMMCLAVAKTPDAVTPSVIGSVQQQNLHVLFDVANRKVSFAPAQCDKM